MRSPRKFYFANAAGERWPLNGERGVWLTDPSGLGLSLAPGTANGRNGFYAVTVTDDVPQGAVYGTLIFTGSTPYADYQSLLGWALAAADGLTIVYSPATTEYYRSVTLTALAKGEIKAPGWLSCEMTLEALSPWYRSSQPRWDLTESGDAAIMRYPWRYMPGLHYPVDSGGQMRATVSAAGHLPAAIEVEWRGPVDLPSLRLIGVSSSAVYGRADISASLQAGERLVYSSKYLAPKIIKITARGAEQDLLPAVDLAHDPWLRVPLREPCTLTLTAASSTPGSAVVKTYDYFWSV